MSCDRVINWKDRRPTREEAQTVIEDFFGDCCHVSWDKDRWFVIVPGKPSAPLARIPGGRSGPEMPGTRWIEVWPAKDDKCLFVMTRTQDHFTNALADSLAKVCASWWRGKLEA